MEALREAAATRRDSFLVPLQLVLEGHVAQGLQVASLEPAGLGNNAWKSKSLSTNSGPSSNKACEVPLLPLSICSSGRTLGLRQ